MSTTSELSVCHFAEITRNPFDEDREGIQFYCSKCGALAEKTIVWDFGQSPSLQVETMIRRFADGDATYESVAQEITAQSMQVQWQQLQQIRTIMDDGSQPVWQFDNGTMNWTKIPVNPEN